MESWVVSLLHISLALSPSDYAEAAIVRGLNGPRILCDNSKKKKSYYAMDRTGLFSTQSFALWAEFLNVERTKMI